MGWELLTAAFKKQKRSEDKLRFMVFFRSQRSSFFFLARSLKKRKTKNPRSRKEKELKSRFSLSWFLQPRQEKKEEIIAAVKIRFLLKKRADSCLYVALF